MSGGEWSREGVDNSLLMRILLFCVGVYAYIRTPIPPHVLLQLIRVLNTHNVINQYDRLTGPLR